MLKFCVRKGQSPKNISLDNLCSDLYGSFKWRLKFYFKLKYKIYQTKPIFNCLNNRQKKSDKIDYFDFHFQVVLITCGQRLPNRWILRSKCYHAEETLLQLSDRQIFWLCLTEWFLGFCNRLVICANKWIKRCICHFSTTTQQFFSGFLILAHQ